MQVSVEKRPGSRVALTVTVEPAVLKGRMEELFREHARRVTVPGFRPGKVPRRLLEERINRQALLQDAIDDVIDTTYKDALRAHDLEPLERGEVEDMKKGEDLTLTYTVLVSIRPEIVLPAYAGLTVAYHAAQVTEEQVDAEIERLRDRGANLAEIADDGIQTGDYVTIDYTMTVDGEAYPDGEASGYPLEVGADSFFPELNTSLLGAKQGEVITVSKTFPDDYSDKELAGKTADHQITVQQVQRMVKSEPTDAWAQLVSQGALQSMSELRERIRHNLAVLSSEADHDHIRGELVRRVLAGTELEVPETLADEQFEHQMQELERRLLEEGMSLEDYAEARGRTTESIQNEQRVLARDMVRRSLVLQEIARREKITVTDEDIDAALARSARDGRSARDVRRKLEQAGRMDALASRLFHEKVLAFLESHAEVTDEGQAAAAPTEEAGEQAG